MPYHDDIHKMHQRRLRQQVTRLLELGQDKVAFLLLDVCAIYPDVGANYTIDIDGVETSDAVVARTYRGFSTIPCRADAVRAFRPDMVSGQPSQVDEIDLHLPIDMFVAETDRIVLNGLDYKIRQLIDDGAMALTKVAKLMRLGVSLD